MTTRVVVRWLEDGRSKEGGLEVLGATTGRVWVDVCEPDEASMAVIAEHFGLHPLSVEDVLHFPQRPKIDAYDHSVFLIWTVPMLLREDGLELHELDAFLGLEYLVTARHSDMSFVDDVASDIRGLERGPAWVLHAILDRAVDGVLPMVDELADRLETLEDEMLADARPQHLERLHDTKRKLVTLHKAISPERDLLRQLLREESVVDRDSYLYFQDIGDHLARVEDSIETYREVASGAMDIYLSASSNRLNVIMKQLTIVATIFMPLTLISGIYGMNFEYMPELGSRYGYPGVMLLMLFIAVSMVAFIMRRKWW